MECFTRKDFLNPDAKKYAQPNELLKVLELVVGVGVLCDNKEDLINGILTNLSEETQSELMKVIEAVLAKYQPPPSSAEGESHQQQTSL